MNIINIESNIDNSVIEYLSYEYEFKIEDNILEFLKILKAIKTGFKKKIPSFIISNYTFEFEFINKALEYIKNVDCIIIQSTDKNIGYVLNIESAKYILHKYDLLLKDIKAQITVESLFTDLNCIVLKID
jgi:hypothetical protein